MYREVKYCETLGEANACLRRQVVEECRSIGITDMKLINHILLQKQHNYFIHSHDIFDEIGGLIDTEGYSVCRRIPV